jgi:hypothetical protein
VREPYRLAVWGTGGLGTACIREVARRADSVVVGGFTYSSAKDGADLGAIAGVDALGVTATTNRDQLRATSPECVLYVARDFADWANDADIEWLLASGVDVVTALPYRRIDLRDAGAAERFTVAAARGGATLYCAGLNPDFFSERLTATLTGLTNHVEHVHLREYFRIDGSVGDEMLGIVGFGARLDDRDAGTLLATMARAYDVPSMTALAEQLGRPLTRVEVTNQSIAAPVAIQHRAVRVEPGTAGMLGIRFDGYSGDQPAPFVTFENFYYLTEVMRPEGAVADEYWTVTIEGRPSLRVTVEALASAERGTVRFDDDPTTPGYSATVAAMLQAVPMVVGAPPGIFENPWPVVHWRDDLRRSPAASGSG